MELGSWSIIQAPSLLALIPLVVLFWCSEGKTMCPASLSVFSLQF